MPHPDVTPDLEGVIEAEEKSEIDLMRILFVTAAVLMVLPLPWYPNFLTPLTPFWTILFAGSVIVFAALFEDRHFWQVAIADVVLSFVGFALAAHTATQASPDTPLPLTLTRELLAIVFAVAGAITMMSAHCASLMWL